MSEFDIEKIKVSAVRSIDGKLFINISMPDGFQQLSINIPPGVIMGKRAGWSKFIVSYLDDSCNELQTYLQSKLPELISKTTLKAEDKMLAGAVLEAIRTLPTSEDFTDITTAKILYNNYYYIGATLLYNRAKTVAISLSGGAMTKILNSLLHAQWTTIATKDSIKVFKLPVARFQMLQKAQETFLITELEQLPAQTELPMEEGRI